MKSVKKRSLKTRRERNKCRVNRLRNQQLRVSVNTNPIFILVALTYGFRDITTAEKMVQRLLLHIFMLTGNPNFPVVNPTIATLQAKADQLQALIDGAKSGNRLIIEQRNTVYLEAKELIRQLGYDIQLQSGGDPEKIHSAGFSTRKSPTPLTAPVKVVIDEITALGTGGVELEWINQTVAQVFLIEISTDPDSDIWYFAGITDAVNIKITGYKAGAEYVFLEAQERYYFRVRAWNHVDFGEYSEVADMVCIG